MSHLKQCSRSAAIAFSPTGPYLAAGTVAGVIDMSFSNTSVIEVPAFTISVHAVLNILASVRLFTFKFPSYKVLSERQAD